VTLKLTFAGVLKSEHEAEQVPRPLEQRVEAASGSTGRYRAGAQLAAESTSPVRARRERGALSTRAHPRGPRTAALPETANASIVQIACLPLKIAVSLAILIERT
jgi:hypothetical protein